MEDYVKSVTDGDHQAPPKSSNGIPFLVISDVAKEKLDFSNTRFVPQEYYERISFDRKPEKGDLLFTVTGSYGIVVPVNTDKKFCFQRHIGLIKSLNISEYLVYLLKSDYIKKQCDELATGTAQKTVGLETLRSFLLPIPPISVQRRVVTEIERWFVLIDQIEQGKTDLQSVIKHTKSKILDLAIHGKLVPQDPNDEPASELLKRINPKAEITCDNAHNRKLPQGWITTELINLVEIRNGYAFKSSKYVSSNGVRLIRIANVQDGYIEDKMPQFYPFDEMEALKDFMLTEGDMLMSLTGNVGRVGILAGDLLPAALNQRVACIKEHSDIIEKKYLFYIFQTNDFSKKCLKSGKGMAQLNISTEWLKHYSILLSPLAEQRRIVQEIEKLFSVLDNIQKALEV